MAAAQTSDLKNPMPNEPLRGSTAHFGLFSFYFILTCLLFFFLMFYHATLSINSKVIHDKGSLYKSGMLKTFPLDQTMTSEQIIKIQNFISDLKSQDTQLISVEIFTKEGLITYSSTLGLIGDHIISQWSDLLTQDLQPVEVSEENITSLIYTVPSTEGLYLALTFKKDSFWTLLSTNQAILIIFGMGTFVLGMYLLNNHILKLRDFDPKTDPLIMEFEKQKSVIQNELTNLSKDLKNYETL